MQEVSKFISNYNKINLDWAYNVFRRKSRHFSGCLVWMFFLKKPLFKSKSDFDDKKYLWNASYKNLPEKYSDLGLVSPRIRSSQIKCNCML